MSIIHHYTSINTLALILKYQTIRFNRLDRVDDLSETGFYGKYQFGKFLFVSCWTDSSVESIPLWHMYTDNMRGVRISLESDWMYYRPLKPDPKYKFIQKGTLYAPIPFEKFFNDNYMILPFFFERDKLLKKVKYVDDPSIYLKDVVDLKVQPDGVTKMQIKEVNDFATYKKKIWSFQEEVRFVLFILPTIPIPPDGFSNENYLKSLPNHIMNSIINGNGPNLENFDIDIDAKVLDDVIVNQHIKDALKALPRGLHHDFVITYRGEPLSNKFSLKKQFSETCKKANIPYGRKTLKGVTFHDIRRTVKTNMAAAGLSKVYRDTILGHSLKGMDIHYIVPSDDDLTEAMDKYTKWLDGKMFPAIVDQTVDHKAQKNKL